MKNDRAFFQRLGVRMHREVNADGARASKDILTNVWRGRLQRFAIVVAYLLKLVGVSFFANRIKARYQCYLDILAARREGIETAMALVVDYFEQWEEENRRDGCGGYPETYRLEQGARSEAHQAIRRMQEELASAGWPHQLKRVHELAPSFEGRTYDHSPSYWDGLHAYLTQTIEKLR